MSGAIRTVFDHRISRVVLGVVFVDYYSLSCSMREHYVLTHNIQKLEIYISVYL